MEKIIIESREKEKEKLQSETEEELEESNKESDKSSMYKEVTDQWMAICNESSEYKRHKRNKYKTKRIKTDHNYP